MTGLIALIIVSPVAGRPARLSSSERYQLVGGPFFVVAARVLERHLSLTYTVLCAGVLVEGVLASFWLSGRS